MFWKKIKAVYNKENFDHTKRFIDPKIYHVIFFTVQRAYQVIDEPFASWTYVTKTITALCGVGVLTDACLSLYHAIVILDMNLITESSTYVFMLVYQMMTLTTTKVNLSDYIHLINAMKEDFKYIETKKEKYRYETKTITVLCGVGVLTDASLSLYHAIVILDMNLITESGTYVFIEVFLKTQLGTWKACFIVITFMFSMGTSLVLFASGTLIVYYLTHTPGDGSHRRLVFPFWAPGVDYTATPAFEIAFTFANIGVMACCYNYAFVIQTNIVWIRQIASKADFIGMCINDLLEGIYPTDDEEQKQNFASLINFRMREIVSQHIIMYRLLENYAAVYRKCLMFEQFVASPLVCSLVYCSAEKIDNGEVHVVMMVLCLSAIVVLFIPCYLCTYLRTKLTGIHDACWNIRFWDAGPNIRPYLVIIMQRCLRPLPLQMPGFQEVSIRTYSSSMTSAYSLFNMLRQADLDF